MHEVLTTEAAYNTDVNVLLKLLLEPLQVSSGLSATRVTLQRISRLLTVYCLADLQCGGFDPTSRKSSKKYGP
jgi:hypothetical protein